MNRGIFDDVSDKQLINILRELGRKRIVTQLGDKTISLGDIGEYLVGNYRFYSVFETPQEYTLYAYGKKLGSLPTTYNLKKDSYLIFGGQRWSILSIDDDKKLIDLVKSNTGKAPIFSSSGINYHDKIFEKMFALYTSSKIPNYLDSTATKLYQEGLSMFVQNRLLQNRILESGINIFLFPWKGSSFFSLLSICHNIVGIKTSYDNIIFEIPKMNKKEYLNKVEKILSIEVSDIRNHLVDHVKDLKKLENTII